MPHKEYIREISQIFLSATAQDCKEYRVAVSEFIHDNIDAAKIFLQENWADGAKFVVTECEKKIKECDAYVGLFGYRYGWTPPGFSKSITELEFHWALDKWESTAEPPIFVFLPEKGSEADMQLRAWAQECLHQEYPDEDLRTRSQESQAAFLALVKQWASEGRILVYYRTPLQLLGKALSCVQNWNKEIWRNASMLGKQTVGAIPTHLFGRLGTDDQRKAIENNLEVFRDQSNARAICFLTYGPENHGQREFSEFLYRWEEEWEETQVYCGQASEADSIESLIRWTSGQLKTPMLGPPSIDALATVISARLAQSSVVFVLRTVGRKPDRLSNFQAMFWAPLVSAIANAPPASRGRLYWFVIDHEMLPETFEHGIRNDLAATPMDYTKFLVLPPLTEIKSSQVRRWLQYLKTSEGVETNENQRNEISERVTYQDRKPSSVFDRLTREGFWP